MKIIAGKEIGEEIQEEVKEKIASFPRKRRPRLAMVLVGNHPPSRTYVEVKKAACTHVGIASEVIALPDTTTFHDLVERVMALNADPTIDGILLQSPLPSHLDGKRVIERIDPHKDVDGFHPLNMGKLLLGEQDGFIACTPLGIMEVLKRSSLEIAGQHVVIVGRSNIVGKPLAALMLQANATVTVAHSQTRNLSALTQSGDIVVAAVGKARFIKGEMVRKGAVVIDVGINREEDAHAPKGYRLVGDVDFEEVAKRASAITPVPGGIGPMTVACLLRNTLQSFLKRA